LLLQSNQLRSLKEITERPSPRNNPVVLDAL
jgi:hypothetical protein